MKSHGRKQGWQDHAGLTQQPLCCKTEQGVADDAEYRRPLPGTLAACGKIIESFTQAEEKMNMKNRPICIIGRQCFKYLLEYRCTQYYGMFPKESEHQPVYQAGQPQGRQ